MEASVKRYWEVVGHARHGMYADIVEAASAAEAKKLAAPLIKKLAGGKPILRWVVVLY